MKTMDMTRRGLFAGAAALPLASSLAAATAGTGFKLGVASYSLRKFPRDKAIEMIKALKVDQVSIKDFHMPVKGTSAEERAAASKAFRDAGIEVKSCGVIQMKAEGELKGLFQYAKDAGIPMMITMPSADNLPAIEKLVKEFDMKVAIHNHGPEDKVFPSSTDAFKLIKNLDKRIGLCVDVGHEVRTGSDLLKVFEQVNSRLMDVHVKDLTNLREAKSQVPVGDGNIPLAAMFKHLKKVGYTGNVMLEYEIDADNPLPGMQKSFSYMRGILAGLNA